MIFRPILGSSIFGAWVREWGSDSRMTDYKSRVKFDSYHINLDRWYSTTRSPTKIIMTNYQKMVDDASGLLRTKKSWAGLKAEHVARMKLQNQFKVGLSAKWIIFLPVIGRFLPILSSIGIWYYDADNSLKTGLDVAKYTATIMRKDMADYDNDST